MRLVWSERYATYYQKFSLSLAFSVILLLFFSYEENLFALASIMLQLILIVSFIFLLWHYLW
ncbi:hypothetical protein ML8HA_00499 [Lactococcus lactis]|nr:hypothetical protein [Lactococcus lactis]